MPTDNLAEQSLSNFEATWNGTSVGYVQDADPSTWQLKTIPRMAGKFGDIEIGRIIIGMAGEIKMTLEQVKKETVRQLCPWWSSGTVPMSPAIRHKDLYDYAQQLIIKPVGAGNTDDDITLLKAVPLFGIGKGDGVAWRKINVIWVPFPDRTALASNNYATYGYFGPPA